MLKGFLAAAVLFFASASLLLAQTIVAKGSLTNQTSTLGTTTLYTSASGGDFMLYLDVQTDGAFTGTITDYSSVLNYFWTDEMGAQTNSFNDGNDLEWYEKRKFSSEFPYYFRLTAGSKFQIDVTGAVQPGDSYNLYWTIKQLGAVGTY